MNNFWVPRDREFTTIEQYFAGGGRVLYVTGPAGVGKTALVRLFLNDRFGVDFGHDLFPGGVSYLYGFYPERIIEHIRQQINFPPNERAVVVVDEAEQLSKEQRRELIQLLSEHSNLSAILSGRETIQLEPFLGMVISLGGLDREAFKALLFQEVGQVDESTVDNFYNLISGNPLMAKIGAECVKYGHFEWNQIIKAFGRFSFSGIVGPDSRPLDVNQTLPSGLIIDVQTANQKLLSMIKGNPELLRSLPPRKFEEIVGELFRRQGYEVKLTPSSCDGGFDLYVARKESIGRFLYLVECKRYTPPKKVGIQIVRQLYGVVQQKNANAGIIVTTSFFTRIAKLFQQELKYQIHLKDYIELQKWLGII